MKTIKCFLIGDVAVGKTALQMSFASNEFQVEHVPTIVEHCSVHVAVGGGFHSINLVDTSGDGKWDHIRQTIYHSADIFLVCFAVNDPASFTNVKYKWLPEIAYFAPDVPFFLVGTKVDLRDDADPLAEFQVVTRKVGEKLAKKNKAIAYLECSAKSQYGLNNVFQQAYRAVLRDDLDGEGEHEESKKTKKKGSKKGSKKEGKRCAIM